MGGAGNDSIAGGDGQDVLGGESGDDILDGGPGVDRFWGDAIGACIPDYCGQDQIRARDGNQETLNCGPGTDSRSTRATTWSWRRARPTRERRPRGRSAGGGRAAAGERPASDPPHLPGTGQGHPDRPRTAKNGTRIVQAGHALKRVRRAGRVKILVPMSDAAVRLLNARGSLKVMMKTTFRRKGARRLLVQRRPFTLHPVGS